MGKDQFNQERKNIINNHHIEIIKGIRTLSNPHLGIRDQQLHNHWSLFDDPKNILFFTIVWPNHPNNEQRTWGIGQTVSTLTYYDRKKVRQPNGTESYVEIPHDLFGGKLLVVLETPLNGSKKTSIKVKEIAEQFLRLESGHMQSDQPWLSLQIENLSQPKKNKSTFQMPSLPWFR